MKLRRKRVRTAPISTTPKRRRNGEPELERINLIESLSRDVLIKLLRKVDHSDLKNVLLVSKSFYQATLVAREIHHSYNTPVKPASERLKNLENDDKSPDVVIKSVRNRDMMFMSVSEKTIADVEVVLFQDDEDLGPFCK